MTDTIKINSKNVKMVAHRGLSGLEPENTSSAFIAAGNRSYYGIETDVHVTRDGKFVVIHDETTTRVSKGAVNINVEKKDYYKIENIVLPDLDGTTYRRDIKIPLLSEYIHICKKYGKKAVLEVKNHFSEENIKRLVEEITMQGYIENVIFISFDMENCLNLRKILPDNEIQWLVKGMKTVMRFMDIMVANRLDIDIAYTALSDEAVKKLHEKDIKVNCWTCDKEADAEKLVNMGVDFITTNILE